MTATQEIVTPTVRASVRRSIFWVSLVAVGLLIVLALALLTRGASAGGSALSPTNPGPNGSMALAEVLRHQGVTVTHAVNLVATRAALEERPEASVFVVDNLGVLAGSQLERLQRETDHLIVMAPAFDQLDGFAPEVAPAGNVEGVLDADCDVSAVATAARVTGDGVGYRLIDDLPGAIECLDSGVGVKSLIQFERDGGLVTILGAQAAFTNEQVGLNGNAALALWLLGASDELIWYETNIADAAVPGAPTIGELTPAWVSAAILLLGFAILALALWKGRRFGPLVMENLPVTVRASETMEGRARLYQKSNSRLHSLDTLRVGTISRLASLGGLGRNATVDEVVTSATSLTGFDAHWLRGVLIDTVPRTDAQLMALSDSLLELERAVAARLGSTATPTTSPGTAASPDTAPTTPGQGE